MAVIQRQRGNVCRRLHSHIAVNGGQLPFGLGHDDGCASIGLLADFQRLSGKAPR